MRSNYCALNERVDVPRVFLKPLQLVSRGGSVTTACLLPLQETLDVFVSVQAQPTGNGGH